MITTTKKPQKITPSDNPSIFQFESDFPEILFFKVEVLEAASNAVITVFNIDVRPDYPTGSTIDVSKVIRNAVKWEINNTSSILTLPISKPILRYKLRVTEYGTIDGVIDVLSPTVSIPSTFTIWNAKLDRFTFNKFIYTNHVITTGLPVKFLTNKPNRTVVNQFSSEQLYFMHEEQTELYVVVKTYNSSNALIQTYFEGVSDLFTHQMFRIQVSPKSLEQTMIVNFNDVAYYTVHIEGALSIKKSETRTFIYDKIPCHIEPQNMFWINSLGGVDTYQFVNVDEVNNITKTTIKKNEYQIDNENYTDRTGEILNPTEEIVDVMQEGNYTAYSLIISDEESKWLNELFISEQAFVELADGSLIPVIVTNTSYAIQKQKKNKSAYNTTQVNYKLNGELIPTDATAYSAGIGNGQLLLDFIDSQMETVE